RRRSDHCGSAAAGGSDASGAEAGSGCGGPGGGGQAARAGLRQAARGTPTNQQQPGIEQVMGALQNIRQASQQTAAGTREVEAASANLTELAQALMALAERYRH
ncbi:hypothetical protein MKL09_27440, partial [Methylobacterium sp. J-048]|nr:hypothetical protein [Methylobacterium sp. J-048]